MDRVKGQNLIEFLLILVLVAIGGIFALTMLGGNVMELFSKSAEKQADFDPFNAQNEVAIASPPGSTGGSQGTGEDSLYTVVSSEVIDGYPVDRNSDGSMTLNLGSQTVNISADVLALNDAVFETSGASGDTLVSTIAYMVEQYQDEYPEGVPVELFYGTGERIWNEGDATYTGNAMANSVTVKVGNKIVLFQNDQETIGAAGVSGVFRLEGEVSQDNVFSGSLTGNIDTGFYGNGDFTADYTGRLSSSGGMVMDGDLDNCSVDGTPYSWTYDWDFDFPYNFDLS